MGKWFVNRGLTKNPAKARSQVAAIREGVFSAV